jgi:hypothetical protein
MPQIRCFVSYCHDDVQPDFVNYLSSWLRHEADGKYELLVDTQLQIGSRIDRFMAEVGNVDAVILLLSPAYKDRIDGKQGKVYEEFVQILARYNKIEAQRLAGLSAHDLPDYFEILPVIVAGGEARSVPSQIAHFLSINLVGLHAMKEANAAFGTHVNSACAQNVRNIAARLKTIRTTKTSAFKRRYLDYYKALFLDLKAPVPRAQPYLEIYQPELFVETLAYKKIEQQAVYFVVGRKGSGKSTAAGAIAARQRHRYKGHVSIIANDFNLEALYAFFASGQIRSDVRRVFDEAQCFQWAWELFLYLCTMQLLVDLDDAGHLSPEQSREIPPIKAELTTILGIAVRELDEGKRNQVWFTFVFSRMSDFVKDCIDSARDEEAYFLSDVQARFTRKRFFRFATQAAVDSCERALATCRKKILITLDGFDSAFDEFRRTSNRLRKTDEREALERNQFELIWLKAFLRIVLEIKQPHDDDPGSNLRKLLEVCITVPSDRYEEVKRTERDGFLYLNKESHLDWTGLELCTLVRKRLEKLCNTSTNGAGRPHEHLQTLFDELGFLPTELKFDFRGKQIRTPLFLYLLRHTFWRPREILMHLAPVIAAAEEMKSLGSEITTEGIRRIVSQTAIDVVTQEFIGEWESTLRNISQIVSAFRERPQVSDYANIKEILDNVKFAFAAEGIKLDGTNEKIEYLYEIGFLGLKLSRQQQRALNTRHLYAFYFNEGRRLIRSDQQGGLEKYRYVIHPAFAEYLHLERTEYVLAVDWNYLYQ